MILHEITRGIATITLNRPDKLNAFAGTMREDLISVLEEVSGNESVRVAVITGAGRAFCSGGDVEAMSRMQKERDVTSFGKLLEAGSRIVTLIHTMPQFVIAMVNGVAAGAGCNLALACDYRIAATTARLGETFVRIGLHPDWGGSWFLPRLVGEARAMELMMTGRLVDAGEALRIGMVDQLEEPEALLTTTMRLAESIAAGPAIPIAGIKRAAQASATNTLGEQLALEARHQEAAFLSSDSAEGIAAFFEKRDPRFRGK
ncbi:MAG TPA: enoyl-CoA hydratase-related protein [Thermoanaerobaculia bacterium]|nr:enoyl-CoA hydratase-related protein [Thermoanaerobaculia bacterium]